MHSQKLKQIYASSLLEISSGNRIQTLLFFFIFWRMKEDFYLYTKNHKFQIELFPRYLERDLYFSCFSTHPQIDVIYRISPGYQVSSNNNLIDQINKQHINTSKQFSKIKYQSFQYCSNSQVYKRYSILIQILIMDNKIDVWLDCDPGLDDILAIIYAAHSERINLVGLSTSPGNTSLKNTTRNGLDMLYHIGRKDVQVYAGSNQLINGQMKYAHYVHGENGLGGVHLTKSTQNATEQNSFYEISQKIMKNQNKIIWANTGSLTNICILLLTYPKLKQKIKEIVIMGGAINKGNITPAAQFNIFFDPTAFQNVLKLKGQVPLVMIPLQTTHKNIAGLDVYEKIKQYSPHPFGLAIYNMMLSYQQFYVNVVNMPYPPYHDQLTIFYILHPQQFEVKPAFVEVDIYPTSYGRTNINFSEAASLKRNTFVTVDLLNKKSNNWDDILKIMELIFSQGIQKKIGIEY